MLMFFIGIFKQRGAFFSGAGRGGVNRAVPGMHTPYHCPNNPPVIKRQRVAAAHPSHDVATTDHSSFRVMACCAHPFIAAGSASAFPSPR